jgi:hypothetical protein
MILCSLTDAASAKLKPKTPFFPQSVSTWQDIEINHRQCSFGIQACIVCALEARSSMATTGTEQSALIELLDQIIYQSAPKARRPIIYA